MKGRVGKGEKKSFIHLWFNSQIITVAGLVTGRSQESGASPTLCFATFTKCLSRELNWKWRISDVDVTGISLTHCTTTLGPKSGPAFK